MIMEAVKRNVCRGVIFLMACLTCVVVFGSGLIAEAAALAPYAPYTTYTGSLGIYGSKTLTGREFQAGDKFTFKIVADSNNPTVVEGAGELLKEVTIHPTEDQEQFDFDAELTFEEPGNYTYYIFETQPKEGEALPYITYDKTIYRLTVTVGVKEDTGNETGGKGAPGGETDASANGESNALATAGSEGEGDPVVDSSDPVENNITPADGGEENGPSGDGDNQSGEGDSQSRDDSPKDLEVKGVRIEKSKDNGDSWEPVGSGETSSDKQYCAFINQYIGASVDLTGTKMLEGREFQPEDEFTFKIEPEDGAPAPVDDEGERLTEVTIQPTSGENPAEIDFGTIYFTPEVLGEGENAQTFTYTYTITEQPGSIDGMTYDTDPRTVQIQVTTQEDGSMKAEVVDPASDELSWTNTWKDPDEPGDGPGDDPGDDPRPSDTSLTVNKEWILDDGGEAPVSVTVELLRNNRVYEEVTLDEDNDWSHTWTRLDARYNWKVQEADVPDGFTAEVSHRGTIWTITNDDIPEDPETPPEEPDEPDTPEDPDTPDEPDIPGTPDEPDVPDTPDTPDEPNTPNEPTLPQTGQNWRLVWILAITGAVLVLVGILGKKRYHGKHEA